MNNIEQSLWQFLSKTKAPVMTDIQFLGMKNVTFFPSTIPDLTVGAPLIVCGKYEDRDSVPKSFFVTGKGPKGVKIQFQINTQTTENAPLHQLVEKSRLDVLTGKWYMSRNESEKEKLKLEAIQGSTENSIPCVWTQAVAYENQNNHLVMEKTKGLPDMVRRPTHATGVTKYDPKNNSNRQKRSTALSVGAVATGGVVVLGVGVAAFYAFGNSSATMSNSGVANAMVSIGSDGYNAIGSVGEAGWNAVSTIDWGAVGGGLGSAMDATGNALGSAVNVIGSADYGGMAAGAGQALGGVGNALGGAAGQVGSLAGQAGGAIGNAVQSCNCMCFKIDENMLNCGGCPCSPLDTINNCGGCNLCGSIQSCNICGSCPAINVGDVFSGFLSCNPGAVCGSCDCGSICGAAAQGGDAIAGAGAEAGGAVCNLCSSIPFDGIGECIGSSADCLCGALGSILNEF